MNPMKFDRLIQIVYNSQVKHWRVEQVHFATFYVVFEELLFVELVPNECQLGFYQ
jgi:hypothetical protein